MADKPTLLEARATISDYWNSAEEDFSHIHHHKFCATIVYACEVIEDEGTTDDLEEVEHLLETAPSLFDFDKYGNFTGNVANENGITT
jgi:hypothetical protein